MSKRYKLLGFSTDIYCSSSADHFTEVWYMDGTRRWHRDFHFEGDGLMTAQGWGYVKVPQYLIREIKHEFLNKAAEGKIKVHEIVGGDYHGERAKRYEDLRYHDPEWLADTVKEWCKELGV